MARLFPRRTVLIYTLAGAAIGFALLHPYTMLVYGIHGKYEATALLSHIADSFTPSMLHMGLPFALIGGIAGLFFGYWLVSEKKREQVEMRACAVNTLKQLMVTLSHYLLNASAVMGGYAAHVLKTEKDADLRKHIEAIREEAEYVEAVVKSLQSLEAIVTERYSKDSETMMLDIKSDLEKRLAEKKAA